MTRDIAVRLLCSLLAATLLVGSATAREDGEPAAPRDDERTLQTAGLPSDGPALLAFFHARCRAGVDPPHLRRLLDRLASSSKPQRSSATAEFLGLGPLAVPTLRRAAHDLENPELADRAAHCLQWLEGSRSTSLTEAAARILIQRKPQGTVAALLEYLPFADNPDVSQAIITALTTATQNDGRLDPALLRALANPLASRRVAAGVILSRAASPEQLAPVRKLLNDPAPAVRRRVALALAEADDEQAIRALIDRLADAPLDERKRLEDFLQGLAAEWAPARNFAGEDEIGRKIRRDTWAVWWDNVDGPALLAAIRKRTLTSQDRLTISEAIGKLSSSDFAEREAASEQLFALGRRSLPQLRDAVKDKDPEVAQRAKLVIERIEREPGHRLPAAAIRLLAVRKPAGAIEALLAYLPSADEEGLSTDVRKALAAMALREGKPHLELVRALDSTNPQVRAAVAEALISGGGAPGRGAIRKLLQDKAAQVRMRVALALTMARDRDAVPVLIDLVAQLPDDQVGQVEDALYQLAGEAAPNLPAGNEPAKKKQRRDAWAAWWKSNGNRIDLARLTTRPTLGFTVICDPGGGRVYEVDRGGKVRWSISVPGPVDAWVVAGERVLVGEAGNSGVSERDVSGKVIWRKAAGRNVMSVQPLPGGNVFIATDQGALEVTHDGKEVYSVNVQGGVFDAYRTRTGLIACLLNTGQCTIVDRTGKQLTTFPAKEAGPGGSLDVLANGRLLVASPGRNKVIEYGQDGKKLLELDAPGISTATGLSNGHILVTSQNSHRVYELDRSGKVVWEQKNTGMAFRARRR